VLAHVAALHAVAVAEPAQPRPGEESGRTDAVDESPSTLRLIGRGLLFVPRTVVDVVFLPLRGSAYLIDRYQLFERYHRRFGSDARTISLAPTVRLDSGFGFTVGARFLHRDLFGEREQLTLRGNFGGRFRGRVTADVNTGHRFGDRVSLRLGGELERRPKDVFYGIGNDAMGPEARHRQQLLRAKTALELRPVDDLHLRVAGALTDLGYGASDDGTSIEMLYDTSTLVGWDGARNLYGELALRWDSRRSGSPWETPSFVSTGWLAEVYAGRVHQLWDATDYWRYGFAAQRFFRIGAGPRVLATRLQGDAISDGDATFTELPQLGGALQLRGYPWDRFRDRVAALGSVEYQWDLVRHMTASVFVDAGRVYPALDELTLDGMRVGYGVGVQVQTTNSFVGQASLASSKDGGLFLNFTFDPVFRVSPREDRR
jgi:hypothetical protein